MRSEFTAASKATELLSKNKLWKNIGNDSVTFLRLEVWGEVAWKSRVREILELFRDADFAMFHVKVYLGCKSERENCRRMLYFDNLFVFGAQHKGRVKVVDFSQDENWKQLKKNLRHLLICYQTFKYMTE